MAQTDLDLVFRRGKDGIAGDISAGASGCGDGYDGEGVVPQGLASRLLLFPEGFEEEFKTSVVESGLSAATAKS